MLSSFVIVPRFILLQGDTKALDMTTRKPLSKKIRFGIFKRDYFICQYCGGTPPSKVLEVDHIHPVKDGGDNSDDNLITACFDCNRGKGAEKLSVIPSTMAEKSAILKEKKAQLVAYEKQQRKHKDDLIDRIESIAEYFEGLTGAVMTDEFKRGKLVFAENLTIIEMEKAIDISVRKFPESPEIAVKYFCGICWTTIRKLES